MAELFADIMDIRDGTQPYYRGLVGGCWTCLKSQSFFPVENPATHETIAFVPDYTRDDLEAAIAAARSNADMQKLSPPERLHILEKAAGMLEDRAEAMARIITLESGKPIAVSAGEVKATVERLKLTMEEVRVLYGEYIPGEWVADTKGKFAIVLRNPLGVVAAISPFNYPLFIGAAKIVPALLAGNAVIAKPASDTPLALLHFVRILEAAGLPEGAINIVSGRGSSVGDALVSSPGVDAVSFTGSTAVGEHIARIAGIKKLHLELGGKAAAIVMEDADLDLAAAQVCKGSFRNSGQRCDAVSRVLVQKSVAETFTRKVVAEASNYRPGDPLDPSTTLGTLINAKAKARVDGLVDDALAAGATLLSGGKATDLFYPATVLGGVTSGMRVSKEEIFGPVLPLIPIENEAEALTLANASEYGLDSCVFTKDLDRALRMARALHDGSVTINAAPAHGVGHFPFGGNKKSGLGREGIKYSIDELTKLHTIIVSSAIIAPS
jgi:acyl-CoA reductase-like NAD-dependent aldehyde dehydrogenase